MNTRTMMGWVAGLLLLAAAQCGAVEQPVYKCGNRYSDRACAGGQEMATPAEKKAARRYAVPPQDRAFAARRAQLSPEDQKECRGLDVSMREQKAILKEKGEAGAPETDSALVKNKLRYRYLRC